MSATPKHDDMEVRHAAAAGLDVRKMQVTATVRTHAGRERPPCRDPRVQCTGERCWVSEYSGLERRICPTFSADVFFNDSVTIRDGFSSPRRFFQVAIRSGHEQYQAAFLARAVAVWLPSDLIV